MQELFLELIHVAVGNQDRLSRCLSDKEWSTLYAMSEKQTMIGICFRGIQQLPQEQKPSAGNYYNWLAATTQIQQQSEMHRKVICKVARHLKARGINAIFMKGLTCASRYPQPELRQCGDIDFVVRSEDFEKTLGALEEIGTVDHSLIHEHHGMAWVDGVTIEPHYKIHNYQNPKNDKTMRKLQKAVLNAPACYVDIAGEQIRVFPQVFEGMFLVSHMVNHVYEEGLGLRQVLDYYYWLGHFDGDKEMFFALLDKMQMRRAARIFGLICENYIGLEKGKGCMEPASEKDIAFADKFIQDIMAVGNFASGIRSELTSPTKSYWWVTKRSLRLAYLCPSEAYWWPVSKMKRYIWKKTKSA